MASYSSSVAKSRIPLSVPAVLAAAKFDIHGRAKKEWDTPQEIYEDANKRTTKQKMVYDIEQRDMAKHEFMIFTMPLLILQLLNATLPMFTTTTHDKKLVKVALSAISTAVLAARTRFGWGKKSHAFEQAAQVYNRLDQEMYLKRLEADIVCVKDKQGNLAKSQTELFKYLRYMNKQERRICQITPVPNDSTVSRVEITLKNNPHAVVVESRREQSNSWCRLRKNQSTSNMGEETRVRKKNTKPVILVKPSDSIHNYDIAGMKIKPAKVYRIFYKRYEKKLKIYQRNQAYYRKISYLYFILPLLIFQITTAVLAVIYKKNSPIGNLAHSVIAAVAGAWIGAQEKLKWEQKSAKFGVAAKIYDKLYCESYLGLINSDERYALKEKDKLMQKLIKFIEFVKHMEHTAVNKCPIPRAGITDQVEKEDRELAEAKKNYNNNIDDSECDDSDVEELASDESLTDCEDTPADHLGKDEEVNDIGK